MDTDLDMDIVHVLGGFCAHVRVHVHVNFAILTSMDNCQGLFLELSMDNRGKIVVFVLTFQYQSLLFAKKLIV
jgi:hypothetical protein